MSISRQVVGPEPQYARIIAERYFFPKPVPRSVIIIIVVGVLLAIIGIILQSLLMLGLGLLGLLLGCVIAGVIIRGNPNDAQYDRWVKEQGRAMLSRALETFRMNEREITDKVLRTYSSVLPGSQLASQYPANEVLMKRGKDGRWRFSINVCTYIIPTDQHIAIFMVDMNALNPQSSLEQTEEYAYRDIIAATVRAFTDTVQVGNRRGWYRIEQMALKISNGEVIDITASLRATPIENRQSAPTFAHPGFEETLAKLRRLLRSHHQSSRW